MISIGIFDYVNVWPLYYRFLFEKGDPKFKLIFGSPARLNHFFKTGNLDASALSSTQYAFFGRDASLIPSLGLSSQGAARSVVLVSKKPLDELHGKEIAATHSSSTSAILLKIILNELHIKAQVNRSDAPILHLKKSGQAALFIGDQALESSRVFSEYARYDLGELWTAITGKPFVWALWGIRNETLEHIAEIYETFRESRESGRLNLRFLAQQASHKLGMDPLFLEAYYRNFDYHLEERHLDGLKLFYRKAHALDLLPECSSIEFADVENLKTPLGV